MDACSDTTAWARRAERRRMAVLWTFRVPSLCRHVPHEFMRTAVRNSTLIITATTCHQRNCVERDSRYNGGTGKAAGVNEVGQHHGDGPIGGDQAEGTETQRSTQTALGGREMAPKGV